jgi:hypothetical protein
MPKPASATRALPVVRYADPGSTRERSREQSGPLSDLFLGRTDNIDIRFAAAIALLFNVLMVVVRSSPSL